MSIQQQKLQQMQYWQAKLVRKHELSNLKHQAPPISLLILFSRQAAVPLVSSHPCHCCHISRHPGRQQLELWKRLKGVRSRWQKIPACCTSTTNSWPSSLGGVRYPKRTARSYALTRKLVELMKHILSLLYTSTAADLVGSHLLVQLLDRLGTSVKC